MSTTSQEALEHALRTAFIDLDKVAGEFGVDKGRLGGKLRSRSRSIPALMFDTGLLPTLTFLWAKAGKETYEKIYVLLEEVEVQSGKEGEVKSGEKKPSPEELSYSLYLYGVLKFMEAKKLVRSAADPKAVADELVGKGSLTLALSLRVLEPYLIELKKLCEAAYEEEKE
nr:type III-B CRISPR module-associated protein Cmr5 [Candidatus Freyrarchaeum guaymaensis]